MKYICLGYLEPEKFEGMTEDERNVVFDDCFEHNDPLRASGHLIAETPLQPPETAATLYWKNSKVMTTDGPYAETKEQLGGLMILEARDLNHAIQLALKKGLRRKRMKLEKIYRLLLTAFVLVGALGAPRPAASQDAKEPYPSMAPLEQYLMDRDAEIALARSAAPDAISHDASVIVLTRHGYETAVQGKNGWVCWVGRGWMAMFDHPEFWNPRIRAADCLNPPAARSVLPYAYKRTELLLAGHSKLEVIAAIKSAIEKKELPALEPGSVCYMMSKGSYLTDSGGHNGPHLMFYETAKDDEAWGANLTNSPVLSVNYWYIAPQSYPQLKSFPPLSVFLVVVDKWSDGTPAPSM